jgi:hypothetical protein
VCVCVCVFFCAVCVSGCVSMFVCVRVRNFICISISNSSSEDEKGSNRRGIHMFIGFVGDNENIYRVIHDLWTLLQEDDFIGLCDKKNGSYKHVSDFGRLRIYDRLKLEWKVRTVEINCKK